MFRLAYRAAQQLVLLRAFKLALLVLKAHKDRLGLLVLQVLQARLVHRAMLVRKALKARLVIPGQRDPRGLLGLPEILALVVLLAQRVAKVQQVPKVTLVQLDRKAKLGLPGLQARQDPQDQPVLLLLFPVLLARQVQLVLKVFKAQQAPLDQLGLPVPPDPLARRVFRVSQVPRVQPALLAQLVRRVFRVPLDPLGLQAPLAAPD